MARLADSEIGVALRTLPGWAHRDGAILRAYRFEGFLPAIAFVNRVAEAAEAAGHHPDIDIRYSAVAIALTTHDQGGITEKDVALARTLDSLETD